MSDFVARYGPWALVAGASVGLGAAYAEALAAHGLSLVLVARGEGPLRELAGRLRRRYGVQVRTTGLDLARADLLPAVREVTAGLEVGLLVYNAAYACIGPLLDQPVDALLRVVDVNCRAPLVLAHEYGRGMRRRGRGGIVLMSSMAGSQGSGLLAAYNASKAFNLVLAEGLWDELREGGVDVVACRAGATRTPNYTGSLPPGNPGAGPVMEPAAVVEATLAALGRGPSVMPGWYNRAADVLMGRLLPRRIAVRLMGRTVRRLYLRR